MRKRKTKLKHTDKTERLLSIVLSLSFCFMVFFFAAAEIFIRNQKDFLVNAEQVILPMLLLTIAASAVSTVPFITYRITGNARDIQS